MADTQQLSRGHAHGAHPSARVGLRRGPDDAAVTFATVQDGNTVLRLADRSTMTLVGTARIDQLTLFSGNRLRALRPVP